MNLDIPPLFSEELEIKADENNGFVCRPSSTHVVQPLGKSSDNCALTGSTNSTGNDGSPTTPIANGGQKKFTYNKGLMYRRFEGQGQGANSRSRSTNLERNDDSQPGPSGGQPKINKGVKPGLEAADSSVSTDTDFTELGSSVINTAKLLCKSGKINSNQLQQLLKYVTLSRGITSRNPTSERTDQSKLANLISQLAQQSKRKQMESQQQEQPGSQQVDLDGQQVQLGRHQVDFGGRQVQSSGVQAQSVGQQVELSGQNTHELHIAAKETFKPAVTKDWSKTSSTVHSVLCQADVDASTNAVVNSSASTISNRSQGSVETKMLQGIDLQAFTPMDQALSLFELAPTHVLQQDTPQFHPHGLATVVSVSYCPAVPSRSVSEKSPTTLPPQIDVGHSSDNSIMEPNVTSGWEYSDTNLADLLIPDTGGLEAATQDNDWSTTFLASGDGQLLGMLKTGQTDELPGTSGIAYRENNLQDKTQSDVAASEFYCSPEKVSKLELSANVHSNVSSSFTGFALPSTNLKSSNMKRKRYKKTADALQGSGLMDITVKTAELIQRNRKLQKEIDQLKCQAAQFYQSVLQNPENREIGEKLNMAEQQNL